MYICRKWRPHLPRWVTRVRFPSAAIFTNHCVVRTYLTPYISVSPMFIDNRKGGVRHVQTERWAMVLQVQG